MRVLMRARTEQIVADAHDDVAAIEPQMWHHDATERQRHRIILTRLADWLEPVPAHLRELLRQFLHLPQERGRRDQDQ